MLFDYRPSRAREGPAAILNDFSGTLQTDGYEAYKMFEKKEGVTLLACMAHARRKFENALDNDRARAEYALMKIQQLYLIERKARETGYSFEDRKRLREEESLPVLAELEEWLKVNITQVSPEALSVLLSPIH